MTTFEFVSILLVIASVLGIINRLYVHLPRTIALMAGSMLLSVGIIIFDQYIANVELTLGWQRQMLASDLPRFFLDGVLGFMLFAGALHVDVDVLRTEKWTVLALATIGDVIATILYGIGIYYVLQGSVPLPWCFTLGALLAPTDPIAVGGLLRAAGLPPRMLALVNGESLFNDGVSVVIFTVTLHLATGHSATVTEVGLDLLTEAGGGIVLGLIGGYLSYHALRLVDDAALELTITLALVMASYSIAQVMHVSGPLAVVVAGLMTGHRSTRYAMTDRSRREVILFWDLIDELLNALLFLLMGFALLSVDTAPHLLIAGAGGIVLALATRLISVAVPTTLVHLRRLPPLRGIAILTWGGLRGGISIAMALSLEPSPYRGAMLTICYAVVVFSILVQGLTVPALVRRLFPPAVTADRQ